MRFPILSILVCTDRRSRATQRLSFEKFVWLPLFVLFTSVLMNSCSFNYFLQSLKVYTLVPSFKGKSLIFSRQLRSRSRLCRRDRCLSCCTACVVLGRHAAVSVALPVGCAAQPVGYWRARSEPPLFQDPWYVYYFHTSHPNWCSMNCNCGCFLRKYTSDNYPLCTGWA